MLTPLRIVIFVAPFLNGSVSAPSNYSPASLCDLVSSFSKAAYDDQPVDLHFILAPHVNSSSFASAYTLVNSFRWSFGSLSISNATSGGLFDLVLSAWKPQRLARESVLLVEASRASAVHTNWFRYLTLTRVAFGRRADVAAFALQPVRPAGRHVALSGFQEDFFMYEGVPSVPILALHSVDVWRAFQTWFIAQRGDWFLWPYVVAAKSKKDAAWDSYRGTTRAHWSLWFSRFCALHGLYTVYPSRVDPMPDVSHLEKRILHLGMNGLPVRQKKSRILDDSVDRIVELARLNGGSVSLTLINEAFLETARSWICNVDVAGFRPPGVVWIATDDAAYEGLKNVNGSYALRLKEFRGGTAGNSYGAPGYWLLMLERTELIREILDRGVGVFAFETDQVWLRDPVPFVKRIVQGGDDVDIVGTLDSRHEIGGNFLYLNPTLSTRRIWREVCRRFDHAFRSLRMDRRPAKMKIYMENDQSTLTKLVFFDEAFKAKNPVVFRALDTELFVDGRWYDHSRGFYKSYKARSPIMINNNFLVGITKKKDRLIRNAHWFLKDGICDAPVVEKAILDNEHRGVKAGLPLLDGRAGGDLRHGRRVIEGTDIEADFSVAVQAVEKELK